MHAPSLRNRLVAVVAGLLVAGAVGASASSLGGVSAESLGSDVGIVLSCDDDGVTTSYGTALLSALPVVSTVAFGDVDAACVGLDYQMALLGAGGTVLVQHSGVVGSGGGISINLGALSLTRPSAALVTGVSLTITG
ncbi:hypothetical protein [Ilumatobacter sp.]|uniref:hypothetical protein n=1 Tax=Ilumatobacter sp. TaxID=1967498 RepID=UPI003B5177FF